MHTESTEMYRDIEMIFLAEISMFFSPKILHLLCGLEIVLKILNYVIFSEFQNTTEFLKQNSFEIG